MEAHGGWRAGVETCLTSRSLNVPDAVIQAAVEAMSTSQGRAGRAVGSRLTVSLMARALPPSLQDLRASAGALGFSGPLILGLSHRL